MKEYNVYGFINSKDIREHLRKMNYRFDPLQQAFVIWQSCRHTIAEKHRAWQYIIDNLPDMPVPERYWFTGRDSLHKTLADYMATENKYLERFRSFEAGAVYTYETYERRYGFNGKYAEWFEGRDPAHTQKYENCLAAALNSCAESSALTRFRITKHYFDCVNAPGSISVTFDRTGNPVSIDPRLPVKKTPGIPERHRAVDDDDLCTDDPPGEVSFPETVPRLSERESELLNVFFDSQYFDFPTPFKKGDIVCDFETGEPFVLLLTGPWKIRNMEYKDDKRWDTVDMLAYGYSYNKNTGFFHDGHECNYLDLEYYTGELSGGEKLLEYYSIYVKEKEEKVKSPQINEYELMRLARMYALHEAAEKEKEKMRIF